MAAPFYVYDLLASEQNARWNAASPVGTPVSISYSFATAEPSSVTYGNFAPFTSVEQAAARSALSYISQLTNITFNEVSANSGELQFGNGDVGSGYAGRATTNYDASGIYQATVFISNTGSGSQANSDFTPGSITSNDVGGQGWSTLLHEIGHSLGFKHPFEENNAGDPNSVLPSNLDNYVRTIMSYTPYQPSNVAVVTGTASSYSYTEAPLRPEGYSIYDIAALQYLYGVPATGAGKVYAFSPDTPIYETIYDRGANSTIDCSALTGACTINMNAGTTSNLAIKQSLPFGLTIDNQYDGTSALTVAYGAAIANCKGGSGNDRITGNARANKIDGGAGDDTIYGSSGNDTIDGGTGNDRLIAGSGHDTFNELMAGFGRDTVYRANLSLDTFDVAGMATSAIHLHFHTASGGMDTVITGNVGHAGDALVLKGITAADAQAHGHFTFRA